MPLGNQTPSKAVHGALTVEVQAVALANAVTTAYGAEVLDDNEAFADNWERSTNGPGSGDFTVADGKLVLTNGGDAAVYSFATQTVTEMRSTPEANQWYKFTYTIEDAENIGNAILKISDDDPSECGGACNGVPADNAAGLELTLITGTYSTYFKTTTTMSGKGFTLAYLPEGETAGTFKIDSVSLTRVQFASTAHNMVADQVVTLPTGDNSTAQSYTVSSVSANAFIVDTSTHSESTNGQLSISNVTGYTDPQLLNIKKSDGTSVFSIDAAGATTISGLSGVVTGTGAGSGENARLGVAAGLIAEDAADGLVAIGDSAAAATTTGQKNTAVGFESLKTNVVGDNNTAIGYQALEASAASDGTGDNTAVGCNAAELLAGGADNVFIGSGAGATTTAVVSAVVIGKDAGGAVMTTDANGSVLIGKSAGDLLTSGASNTAIGYEALKTCSTGDNNTAVGWQALEIANSADGVGGNTAVGKDAGALLAAGFENVFIGNRAGNTTTAAHNTVVIGSGAGTGIMTAGFHDTGAAGTVLIGSNAGAALTSADATVAVGYGAAEALTTAGGNNDAGGVVAIGYQALKTETTAGASTAVGFKALTAQVRDGGYFKAKNTAVGWKAGVNLTQGIENTFVGAEAGRAVTTASGSVFIGKGAGAQGGVTADANYTVGVGHGALEILTTGAGNVAIGRSALGQTATSDHNTAIGDAAMADANTADGTGNNTAIGYQAGKNTTALTSGVQNVLIGSQARTSAADSDNQIVIGYNFPGIGDDRLSFGKASNVISSTAYSAGTVGWSQASDVRRKQDIQDDTLGLEFINKLRNVTFSWKPQNEYPEEWNDYNEVNDNDTDEVHHGLIAQEVKTALDECGVDTFNIWSEDNDGMQRLATGTLILPLLKAVQELSAKVAELEAKLDS